MPAILRENVDSFRGYMCLGGILMIPTDASRLLRHPLVALVLSRGLGQAAVLISTFYLARLVTPDVYGELGLFTSFCALFSMASGARFEIRALVCRTEGARRKFIAMAYAINVCLLTVALPMCVLAVCLQRAPVWTELVPIGVLLSSLVNYVLPSQNSSKAQLSKLGTMNIIVSLSTATLQIIGAKVAPVGISLVAARLVAWLAGAFVMKAQIVDGWRSMTKLRTSDLRRMYRSSRQEIYYGTASALLGVLELQCAVYVLSFFSQKHAIGMYWMGFNLLFVPFFVVSGSIRPLFLRHLASARKESKIFRLMSKYVGMSFLAGIAFVVPIALAAVVVTREFLGPEWQDVQYFAGLLAITLLVLVARLPISFAASALGMQRLNLAFGLLQVLVRASSLGVPLYMGQPVISAMVWFAAASSGCYLLHIIVSLYGLKRLEE